MSMSPRSAGVTLVTVRGGAHLTFNTLPDVILMSLTHTHTHTHWTHWTETHLFSSNTTYLCFYHSVFWVFSLYFLTKVTCILLEYFLLIFILLLWYESEIYFIHLIVLVTSYFKLLLPNSTNYTCDAEMTWLINGQLFQSFESLSCKNTCCFPVGYFSSFN